MTIRVRRLEPDDERSDFRSGNADLDRFFIRYAGQNQFRHHIGVTYLAVDDADRIVGFVTVAPSEIPLETLPISRRRGLPKHPLPALRVARLAVDERARRMGVGKRLLDSTISLAERLAESVGCAGLVVDAKPDAVTYYEALGFVALDVEAGHLGDRPQPLPMFLPLGSAGQAP